MVAAVPAGLTHTLFTERLTLRAGTAHDADTTWNYRRLDAVNEWLPGSPADIDGYRAHFCEPARLAATVMVVLGNAPGSQVVGDLMLRRENAWAQREVIDQATGAQVELGWVLDPEYTGHGYASEAITELLRYCFEDLGVHRVVANCFVDNRESWQLMERIGMRRELYAVRDALHRSGRWLDPVGYALLSDEWNRSGSRSADLI